MMHRSYRLSRLAAARHVLDLRPAAHSQAIRCPGASPACAVLRVAHRRRRIDSSTPPWVMSDPELRTQLLDRHQRLLETNGGGSHYMRQVRRALDNPTVSTELEETFERSRLLGIPILHPFLDADLDRISLRHAAGASHRAAHQGF